MCEMLRNEKNVLESKNDEISIKNRLIGNATKYCNKCYRMLKMLIGQHFLMLI